MSGLNKAMLIGRLGKDPEVRTMQNGDSVANFSIATSETWKDKNTGEKKESVTWHNLVLWRSLADIAAKYLHKGDQIYVEGKITNRSWEKEGVTRYVTEIVVNNLVMLSTKRQDNSAPPPHESAASDFSNGPSSNPKAPPVEDVSDLPF